VATISPDVPPAERVSSESLLDLMQGLLRELPALVGDRVELFSLEMQRASIALARFSALTAAALVFALTAWLALWGVFVSGLMALGWPGAAALALALLINAGAAAWALLRARSLLKLLSLPATRRHLMLGLRDPLPQGDSAARSQTRAPADDSGAMPQSVPVS
jgi:hypothetical protein